MKPEPELLPLVYWTFEALLPSVAGPTVRLSSLDFTLWPKGTPEVDSHSVTLPLSH